MKSLICSFALSLSLLAFGACDDDDHGAHVTPPECDPIAEGCHESTTAAGIACHEDAHDVWTAAECTANLAMCQAECGFGMPDAGTPSADAAEPDAQ